MVADASKCAAGSGTSQPSSGPPDHHAQTPVLITIAVSHFCEKARWGLQHCGVAYKEEAHAPGFHRSPALRCGGGGPTPVLRMPSAPGGGGGAAAACVDGSQAILRWADERRAAQPPAAAITPADGGAAVSPPPPPPLFPPESAAEIDRLCQLFDLKLGPAARCLVYSHLLFSRGMGRMVTAPPVPWYERAALRLGGWLVVRLVMAKGLGINAGSGAAALSTIEEVFSQVETILSDGRPYLSGQHFTAADLTFAALAAPALGQPYGVTAGLSQSWPAALGQEVERLRGTKAGLFALRMWRQERRTTACGVPSLWMPTAEL